MPGQISVFCLHSMNPTMVTHRFAQHCGSGNKHSTVTAKTITALWQQWKWQCWGNDVYISVTATATDSAATALSVATTFTVMYTSLLHCEHRCHRQRCQNHRYLLSPISHWLVWTWMLERCHCHRCCTFSVNIADTLLVLPSLSQCCLGHCCHNTVKYTAVIILSVPPMSH